MNSAFPCRAAARARLLNSILSGHKTLSSATRRGARQETDPRQVDDRPYGALATGNALVAMPSPLLWPHSAHLSTAKSLRPERRPPSEIDPRPV